MIKYILYWWKRLTSSYIIYEVQQGKWKVDQHYEGIYKYTYDTVSNYTILYNDVKKKYKLEMSGFNPREHGLYPEMIKYINLLNNESK